MPKIIENLEEKLIMECMKQIGETGYSSMTMRSVAKACGVGVGTVYNYFSSKDELVAAFMLKDWQLCMRVIEEVSGNSADAEALLRCMHTQLEQYIFKHDGLFHDKAAVSSFSAHVGQYHSMLRGQLAEPLKKFCRDDFTAEFIAEAMLTWTMEKKSFDAVLSVMQKLF